MRKHYKIISIAFMIILSITAISLVGCSTKNKDRTLYDNVKITKMNNYNILNETAEHNEIVIIGDSIVEIYPTYELYPFTVYNRGISGDTSNRLLERIDGNALTIKPKIMVILIGTNDYNSHLTQNDTVANIKAMIELTDKLSPDTKVIIQSVYPVNKNMNKWSSSMVGGRSNKDIDNLNIKIKSMVESLNNAKYVYADINTVLKTENNIANPDYFYDGLHPNVNGYKAITSALLPYLS